MLAASGEPHRPIFTGLCQLSSIKFTGAASKKNIAKQMAFRAVLDIPVGNLVTD